MTRAPARPSYRLLAAFSLAHAGAVIGYLPLLSLLLPIKVALLAGEERIGWLTVAIVVGAVAASIANVLFGWLSDRSRERAGGSAGGGGGARGRRRWIAGGAVALALAYGAIAAAERPGALVAAVIFFQVAINAVLAPMMAIMADEVPPEQRGLAGGLLALGPPAAGAVSALLVAVPGWSEGARLATVAVVSIATLVPLLAIRAPAVAPPPDTPAARARAPQRLWIASIARLLVQVAGSALSLYLLYYFQSISGPVAPATLATRVGTLLTIGYILPLPVAVLAGRRSDRAAHRTPFLLGSAAVAAAGLLGMAAFAHPAAGAIGFVGYTVAAAVFLALHQAYAIQLLPDPRHRGRDLGLLNLSNTLPSLLGPLLTWTLATPRDFTVLLLVLAALTLAGGAAIVPLRHRT